MKPPSSPAQNRFGPTVLFLMGSLLTWMLNFLFVYVFAAVACARGFAVIRIAGIGVVPFATLLLSLIAVIVTLALLRTAAGRISQPRIDEPSRLMAFIVLATSILGLIAIVWLVLPVALTTACVAA